MARRSDLARFRQSRQPCLMARQLLGRRAIGRRLGRSPKHKSRISTWFDPACPKCDHTFMWRRHAPQSPIDRQRPSAVRADRCRRSVSAALPASLNARTIAISPSGLRPLNLGSYPMQSHAFDINCDSFENAVQRVPNHWPRHTRSPYE